jgi:hypothetical protein
LAVIIAVTSYALSGEEMKARAAVCDDYVPKPFSPCCRKFVSTYLNRFVALHMSAFGTKRTLRDQVPMSAFGGKADID